MRKHYHLMLCRSSEACALLDGRVGDYRRILQRDSDVLLPLENCSQFAACVKPTNQEIPLHILQVCRQIYHEAVLKPFTQARIYFAPGIHRKDEMSPLHDLLDKLVPAQAKAIAHLCGMRIDETFISEKYLSKLKGLKRIDIHFKIWTVDPLEQSQKFAELSGFKKLKTLDLESVRFTVDMDNTDSNKASVLEWIRVQEMEILSEQQQPLSTAD
jgi:hypothetical protein